MKNLSLEEFRISNDLDKSQYELVLAKSNELFERLMNFDWDSTKLRDYSKIYFQKCHVKRLHFSIQCSAYNILMALSKQPGKQISELVYLDYGAGLGTSFMLAQLCGFKSVVYNDYNEEWLEEAKAMCMELNLSPAHFIVGDIVQVAEYCKGHSIAVDIISSRNVIEHLPDLVHYYSYASQLNIGRMVMVDSTSANSYNPLVVLNHYKKHRRIEKQFYFEQRKKFIASHVEGLSEDELSLLSSNCRMIFGAEIIKVAKHYKETKKLLQKPTHITNSREPIHGVWYEHILPGSEFCAAAANSSWNSNVMPGFWDTHYKNVFFNGIGKCLNQLIKLNPIPVGRIVAPFMTVVSVKNG
jgi:2-polyprenyl-3-methyl-5-hydroxy-6-metoxy-1,4-benzoquinol methylase